MKDSESRDIRDRRDTIVFEAEEARVWVDQLAQRAALLVQACAGLDPSDDRLLDVTRLQDQLKLATESMGYIAASAIVLNQEAAA